MEPSVFVGIDSGKARHHVVGLDTAGASVLDQPVANAEAALEATFQAARAIGAPVVCVDQPGSIGALTVAVAQAQGLPVVYLPGRRMRHVAETFAGQAKTDVRDARIIAETARSMPHAVRPLVAPSPVVAELRVVCGVDDDLVKQLVAGKNRIRGLLTSAMPALERVIGPRLTNAGVPELLEKYPTAAALRRLGRTRMTRFLARRGSRRAAQLAADVQAALAQQTMELDSSAGLARVLPLLVDQLQLLAAHPDTAILMSLSGFHTRTVARTVVELDGKVFASAAQLASYAGVAPVTKQSGTSLKHHIRNRQGNKPLRQAWYMAAFASLRHDRQYFDRKRADGLSHVQALLALTRRRVDVLFALLRDRTMYNPAITA